MSVTRLVDDSKNQVVIKVDGRFDFSQHKSFRDSYRDVPTEGTNFIVDLSSTSYLDSSALGMLLLLREHAHTGNGGTVKIRGCSDDVLRVLKIANFEKLFYME